MSGMNFALRAERVPGTSSRLWPGVALALLILPLKFAVPRLLPDLMIEGLLGSVLGGILVLFWWVFFSRAPRLDRWGGAAFLIVAMLLTSRILDKSVAGGMMGMMFPLYSIPIVGVAFVVWAVLCHRLAEGPRRASMVVAILLICGSWALLRTNGITGDGASDLAFRWSKTAEEKLVAQPVSLPVAAAPVATPVAAKVPMEYPAPAEMKEPAPVAAGAAAEWPGFRGPNRDGVVSGLQIKTDWVASPPVELWRKPVGPAWSSFAVNGDLLYTQEQRGEDDTCL